MLYRSLIGALMVCAAGLGGFIAGRTATPAFAEATQTPMKAPMSQTLNNGQMLVPNLVLLRIGALENRADAVDKQIAALNKHVHRYNVGIPGFGYINVLTLKQMMDNPGANGSVLIPDAVNYHAPATQPVTGPPTTP